MLHDCCRFAVLFYPFSAPQVFHVGFQGSIFAYFRVSAVTASSLSFVRLCKFLWILSRPASFFGVLAFLLSLSVCCLLYLHDCLGFHCDFLFPTQTCNSFCVLVRSCSFRPRFREDLASLPFKFRAVHRPAFWVRNCRDFLPSVGGASRVLPPQEVLQEDLRPH